MRIVTLGLAALAGLLLSGCGYNMIQSQDEQIKAAWSEVLNQYQRRRSEERRVGKECLE